jgi:aldose 1-epimerase
MQGIACEPFGRTSSGVQVSLYTLTNQHGSHARLIDLGATLTELWMPDRNGELGDVVLGFDTMESYEANTPFFGCTVGRVANRIAGAHFELDGLNYRLAANDGANHLHGGRAGFDKAVWGAQMIPRAEGPTVSFSHTSPDGDEGYPGALDVKVTYTLQHDDALHIEYRARSDAPTLVNMTNHSYWNLAGSGGILAHELMLRAQKYTEVGPDLIPTGQLSPVRGTPFDFTHAKPIGRDIAALEAGYDHNFVLADAPRPEAVEAATLRDPLSGRQMRVLTTEPGVQLYTANFLDGVVGKRGAVHDRHAAVCLETQRFPDAVHHDGFPSIVLRPGETYQQLSVYAFGRPQG